MSVVGVPSEKNFEYLSAVHKEVLRLFCGRIGNECDYIGSNPPYNDVFICKSKRSLYPLLLVWPITAYENRRCPYASVGGVDGMMTVNGFQPATGK